MFLHMKTHPAVNSQPSLARITREPADHGDIGGGISPEGPMVTVLDQGDLPFFFVLLLFCVLLLFFGVFVCLGCFFWLFLFSLFL